MPHVSTLDEKQFKTVPEFSTGDVIRVHQRIKEVSEQGKERERVQIFEGLVISRTHGKGVNATFTVRKIASGVGVERIFPLHSPSIEKVEVVRRQTVKQSKLYYVRTRIGSEPRVRRNKSK